MTMHVRVLDDPKLATLAAADWLQDELVAPSTRNIMVAAGNTPLDLYAEIARRRLKLDHLNVFALDEYVGVPEDHPQNCANLLRRSVVQAWGIPTAQYYWLSSDPRQANRSFHQHTAALKDLGGLDLVVLGLGQNGHLGFNEPGSDSQSEGGVVVLHPESVSANRQWFEGAYAPDRGVTTGMKTILSSRTILLLAFGTAKINAVAGMVQQRAGAQCPASFLQLHPRSWVFLDQIAATGLAGSYEGDLA